MCKGWRIIKVIVRNLVQENELYKYVDEIKILPLSDIHIGSKQVNKIRLNEAIREIRENNNVFTILTGDLIDMTLKNSIGSVYENELTPMQQVEILIDLLEPIKDKILVVSSGNHERRCEKDTSIDILKLVCGQLGILDRYANSSWYLYLYFGEKVYGRKAPMCYTICGYHGAGGGRSIGSNLNRLVDISNIAVADLYVMSHTHTPASTKKCIYIPDYGNKALILREMHYLMTNSFLEYNNSYGETKGFHPSSTSLTEAVLNGKERKIKVIKIKYYPIN